MFRFILLVCVGLTCAGVEEAQGQSLTDIERSRFSPAAFYNYAEAGDVTMLTNVWGSVQNPGLYQVPTGTHLSTLLSVAGGPAVGTRSQVEDRTIRVRLFRESNGQRLVVYETTMMNEIIVSAEDPVLEEGDILAVETIVRRRFSWRDAFPIVAAVASVALAIERVSR
jgi:hypothetical protein